MVSVIKDNDSSASLLALHEVNDEKTEQNDIVTSIDFVYIVPERKLLLP